MILVTGGTGLVGSHLIYKLIEKGHKIKAIYRSKKKLDAVKHIFSYYSKHADALFSKIEWVEANINDIPSLTPAFKDITKVYHCAAFISFDTKDYYALRKINIEGTANIVNLCLSNTIKKLCYVSSIATLGQSETNTLITENTSWNSEVNNSVYAITKYAAEMEVWRGTQEGLDAVIINSGIILGSGFWYSGSRSLIRRIYKGMSHYTNGINGYVDVHDVVTIMIQLMESALKNERYIVVSENLSFREFFTKIAQQLDVKPPQKEASKLLLQIAWRLDWVRAFMKKKRRRLTKTMAESLTKDSYYSSKKIIADLNFKFKPMDASIIETAKLFLADL